MLEEWELTTSVNFIERLHKKATRDLLQFTGYVGFRAFHIPGTSGFGHQASLIDRKRTEEELKFSSCMTAISNCSDE